DAFGDLAVEYDTQSAATVGTVYVSPDALGSARMFTTDTTTLVNGVSPGTPGTVLECRDYLPFGGFLITGRTSLSCFGADAGVTQHFTGKERDAETGLDYFGARYFSGSQGR